MQFYHDENQKFTDSELLVPLTPNFNTSSYVEFSITPSGGHLQLSDTRLAFAVDLPESVVPENFFASKLFEYLELSINHTIVSSRSSDNDYALTNYFLTRMNWDETSLKTSGSLEGYWDNLNYDSGHFTLENIANEELSEQPTNPFTDERRKQAEKIEKSGKIFFRYYFVTKINAGLALSPQPLPKNVPIKLTFVRADASKSVLSVMADNKDPISERVLDLINPTLYTSFIQSEHYDRKYANHRISRVTFPFLDYKIHRELLLNGVDQFKLKIAEGKIFKHFYIIIENNIPHYLVYLMHTTYRFNLGKLPSALAFAFISPAAFKGDYSNDTTNFKSHSLESFDLQIDSKSIVGYPISQVGNSTLPFYYKFLKECNFYANNYSSGPMTYDAFRKFNFLVVENLRRKNITQGQLIVKLKFKKILNEKLILIIMPVYKKILTFDEYFIPEISDPSESRSDLTMEDET